MKLRMSSTSWFNIFIPVIKSLASISNVAHTYFRIKNVGVFSLQKPVTTRDRYIASKKVTEKIVIPTWSLKCPLHHGLHYQFLSLNLWPQHQKSHAPISGATFARQGATFARLQKPATTRDHYIASKNVTEKIVIPTWSLERPLHYGFNDLLLSSNLSPQHQKSHAPISVL